MHARSNDAGTNPHGMNEWSFVMRRAFRLSILLLLAGSVLPLAAQEDDDSLFTENWPEIEVPPPPQFSRPSSGAGLAVGFGLTGLTPGSLDTMLGGDLVLSSIDAYVILRGTLQGLLLGGSWTWSSLYDPGERYDEFSFGYSGFLLGYDHSLFYGKLTVRPSVLLGWGDITMIRRRPDITYDTTLNPTGREVLERVRDQDFFMLRPGFGIGYSPIDLLQFRADVAFMYPTGDASVDDLRKPVYSLQVVFGSSR